MSLYRCDWAGSDPQMVDYHDREWGVPVHNDRLLFEFLILEGAQAGLSWSTILRKRANYRQAFDNFEAPLIARYDENKVASLLNNPGIVRNRLKVRAAITNAREFLAIQSEFGSFAAYVWQFTGESPKLNAWEKLGDIPAQSDEARTLSKDLQKRGFKFVGPTICYAFMQAVGMVNDHLIDCFRYDQVGRETIR